MFGSRLGRFALPGCRVIAFWLLRVSGVGLSCSFARDSSSPSNRMLIFHPAPERVGEHTTVLFTVVHYFCGWLNTAHQ